MPTPGSIARKRDEAIASLKDSGQRIATLLNIEPPNLEIFFRDEGLRQAEELKALAAFNMRVVQILETEQSGGDYDGMTAKELRAAAEEQGIDVSALRTKTELIQALESVDEGGES